MGPSYLNHVAENIHQVNKLLECVELHGDPPAQGAHVRVVALQDGPHDGEAAVLYQHSTVASWEYENV